MGYPRRTAGSPCSNGSRAAGSGRPRRHVGAATRLLRRPVRQPRRSTRWLTTNAPSGRSIPASIRARTYLNPSEDRSDERSVDRLSARPVENSPWMLEGADPAGKAGETRPHSSIEAIAVRLTNDAHLASAHRHPSCYHAVPLATERSLLRVAVYRMAAAAPLYAPPEIIRGEQCTRVR